ncbi:hypothetical protein [Sinomonas halotolerans]|uniref:Uncharacterized protein n=1 Tax=Sinomonas halotolerans TaxID=1644133 RepID=A0ABU9X094_9MICC
MRSILTAVFAAGLTFGAAAAAAPAFAEPPGPGDQQCVPGQNGNPHPGFKAGVCGKK